MSQLFQRMIHMHCPRPRPNKIEAGEVMRVFTSVELHRGERTAAGA
uniref:Uncharacterized protein n=1 Tax=Arundo donax TaxID=35708 RepID=A0A0A8ZXI6_ARUDO